MNNKAGQKFPLEFKLEAIKLVTEQGYTQSAAGRALGFNGKNISRWIKELSDNNTHKNNRLNDSNQELIRLRKENKLLKMEREILKKAAVFFAGESA